MKKEGMMILWLMMAGTISTQAVTLSKAVLQDKIKGGWAGQVIGCTFGGPTEFRWRSTFISDYTPILWDDSRMQWYYDNAPGLYDDVYMDLTFVQVFEEKGLDAPASDFALAFAHAEYSLWHANIAARYNILRGIMPPQSGHWLNNPHAEDIDYQIEADFSGLMAPGMPNTSAEISDKIGHIMNYGDGWYGGVYVGAMYSLAFISDDVDYVVEEALRVIPKESTFYRCMTDVIRWSKEYPDDWKLPWLKVQDKWGKDVGCPEGVFNSYNIDAKINSAWILLGLLYGDKDFGKTISISTRCGDDSDCNPASSGGILGCMLGYSQIPAFWKQGLEKVEDRDFKYTTMSLNDTYQASMRQALELIKRNGGMVKEDEVQIVAQQPRPVRLEVGFEDHYPVERRNLSLHISDQAAFEFEGVGFAVTGSVNNQSGKDAVLEAELYIDGQLKETSKLTSQKIQRKDIPFWQYQLPQAKHVVKIKVKNPTEKVTIDLNDLVVYADHPLQVKY